MWLREDHPGALLELLQEYAVRGVNMMRIESRPTGEGIGRYCFSVDCEGHVTDRRVGEVLTGLKRVCRGCGSSARIRGRTRCRPIVRAGTTDEEFTEASDWLGPVPGRAGLTGGPVRGTCDVEEVPRLSTELSTGLVRRPVGKSTRRVGQSRQIPLPTRDRSTVPHSPSRGGCVSQFPDQSFRASESHSK